MGRIQSKKFTKIKLSQICAGRGGNVYNHLYMIRYGQGEGILIWKRHFFNMQNNYQFEIERFFL